MKFLETVKKHPKICIFLFIMIVLVVFIPSRPSQTVEQPPALIVDNISNSEPSIQPSPKNTYSDDVVVNDFFEKFNSISSHPVAASDIQRGNIRTKALIYTDIFNMEIVNSTQGNCYISISSSPEDENTILNELFGDCLKVVDVSLSDDDIASAWDALHKTGYMVDGYVLNDITISYIPYVELSKGHSNLRIDISFPVNQIYSD